MHQNSEKYTLTICIVSHGQIELVRQLLRSLENFHPKFLFQVVVLENLKSIEPLNIEEYKFDIVNIQNEVPQGLSANINKVFELTESSAEYFCVINPDVIFTMEVFEKLISLIDSHQLDIAAPLIVDHSGEVQDSFRSIPTIKEIILRYLGIKKQKIEKAALPVIIYPDWIGAMFMLMRSSTFELIGGFDPVYYLYFEDVDFCVRAKANGFIIGVYSDIEIMHNAQRSSHKNVAYLIRHLRSAIKFFTANYQ